MTCPEQRVARPHNGDVPALGAYTSIGDCETTPEDGGWIIVAYSVIPARLLAKAENDERRLTSSQMNKQGS